MRLQRRKGGFTLAEMLVVIAIIGILAGVAFISFMRYQRSLAQLECDEIAKEVFVAAQNHLTMAKSQGYLGYYDKNNNAFGTQGNYSGYEKDGKTVDQDLNRTYYFVFNANTYDDNSVLSLMLPFASIDETIRAGGRYLIRYQPDEAIVKDVFYCHTKQNNRYGYDSVPNDYTSLLTNNRGDRSNRINYHGAVLGWYGDVEAQNLSVNQLKEPVITVDNSEMLKIMVKDPNSALGETPCNLKLLITGVTSGKELSIPLRLNGTAQDTDSRIIFDNDTTYTLILDDISNPLRHFADLNAQYSGGPLIPGEDITIRAIADSTNSLSNIAYSNTETTNSLFGEIKKKEGTDGDNSVTAFIDNFRHLENLDAAISHLGENDADGKIKLAQAIQREDLDWSSFIEKVKGDAEKIAVYRMEDTSSKTGDQLDNLFLPIIPSGYENGAAKTIALQYEGEHLLTSADIAKKIIGLKVQTSGDAGLFANMEGGSISRLELIDFDISSTGSGNAGALAGTLTGTKVTNVLVRTSECEDGSDPTTTKIQAASGSAGGLVGSLKGSEDGVLAEQCAAAVYVVSASGNAGGLIGALDGNGKAVSVTKTYAGGHTEDGIYVVKADDSHNDINVQGSASSGGLIGSVQGNVTIDFSYSTCSVGSSSGSSVITGGLVGDASASGASLTARYCYAVGKVYGGSATESSTGAFLGKGSLSDDEKSKENYYLSGISGRTKSGSGYTELKGVQILDLEAHPVPSSADEDAVCHPAKADAYDKTGKTGEDRSEYLYPTVYQLLYNASKDDALDNDLKEDLAQDLKALEKHFFLTEHYGDWEAFKMILDTDLTIHNEEILYLSVKLPVDQLEAEQNITVLIHGDTSCKDGDRYLDDREIYLVFAVSEGETEGSYTLSLEKSSKIPGMDTDQKKTEWLEATEAKLVVSDDTLVMTMILDDITTSGKHFTELFGDFIPGENVTIACKEGEILQKRMEDLIDKAEDETGSGKKTSLEIEKSDGSGDNRTAVSQTNSLFADPAPLSDAGEVDTAVIEGSDVAHSLAAVKNIRHLENLDAAVSHLGKNNPDTGGLEFKKAVQIADLTWMTDTDSFVSRIAAQKAELMTDPAAVPSAVQIFAAKSGTETPAKTEADCFWPVSPSMASWNAAKDSVIVSSNALGYRGQDIDTDSGAKKAPTVRNIAVKTDGDAGMFGTVTGGSISHLELLDFSIVSDNGNAGALAGSLKSSANSLASGVRVTDILAHHSKGLFGSEGGSSDGTAQVSVEAKAASGGTDTAGNAGGLVGFASFGTIEKSAAALIVKGTGTAGGLAGITDHSAVISGYAGGHTQNGAYVYDSDAKMNNITSDGFAGGLIGEIRDTPVTGSYSTCSAAGTTAGGFAGKISGSSGFTNCYCTGLVETTAGEDSDTKGAFAGALNGTEETTGNFTSCYYFEIINEQITENAVSYLPPFGSGGADKTVIHALDESADVYDSFVGEPSAWAEAEPYDNQLEEYYSVNGQPKYNLKTVGSLSGDSSGDGNFGSDTTTEFVNTHYGDWPAPEIFVINE